MRQLFVSFVGFLTVSAIATTPVFANRFVSPPLLQMVYEGGNRICTQSDCSTKIVVNRNGSFEFSDAQGQNLKGTVKPDKIANLKRQLQRTNFKKVRSHPFKGTCPIAYDGTKTIYRFYRAGKVEEIDSCQVEVNLKHPLFKQADAIASQIIYRSRKFD